MTFDDDKTTIRKIEFPDEIENRRRNIMSTIFLIVFCSITIGYFLRHLIL